MKLTKGVPTEPGLYWYWKEGMDVAVARYNGYARTGSFTHYVGPISPPDLPEPDKIETTGVIGDYRCNRSESGFIYDLRVAKLLPAWSRYAVSKITLERDNE